MQWAVFGMLCYALLSIGHWCTIFCGYGQVRCFVEPFFGCRQFPAVSETRTGGPFWDCAVSVKILLSQSHCSLTVCFDTVSDGRYASSAVLTALPVIIPCFELRFCSSNDAEIFPRVAFEMWLISVTPFYLRLYQFFWGDSVKIFPRIVSAYRHESLESSHGIQWRKRCV